MTLTAYRCANGHVTYPSHHRCPTCGRPHSEEVTLEDKTAILITWTTSTATPPGVREPNHLGIVEFTLEEGSVRMLAQLTTNDVSIGDELHPVYVDELRDPDKGIREPKSQDWDGYRFAPVPSD